MKTLQQIREEIAELSELSTNLLKRYKKKADADADKHYYGGGDTAKGRKRISGADRADMKIKNNKKGIKVGATGGGSSADHKKAKDVAHSIAKSNKNLKVSSVGNDHYVHHKDDHDANHHIHVTHASSGKVHVSHQSGQTGGAKKTLSHADAVKHGQSIAKKS